MNVEQNTKIEASENTSSNLHEHTLVEQICDSPKVFAELNKVPFDSSDYEDPFSCNGTSDEYSPDFSDESTSSEEMKKRSKAQVERDESGINKNERLPNGKKHFE